MKKVITALLIVVMGVSLFAGCGKKEREVFTTKQFVEKMDKLGYDTEDGTEAISEDYLGEGIKEAVFVYYDNGMTVEFVEFDTVENARLAYGDYVMTFEAIGEKSGDETKDEKKDYCRFKLVTDEWDWQLVRNENTLLIFQNTVDKGSDVQEFLKKIEYEK